MSTTPNSWSASSILARARDVRPLFSNLLLTDLSKRTDMNRNGTTSELLSLGIFDDTADASLTLYGALCDSASSFHPSMTVLLISNPGWRIEITAKLTL